MNTTSLVNECYLKLRNISSLVDAERTHFISYASRAMRSIIVNLVREDRAQRRGGGLLSFAEVAQLWSVSERTVRRDWDKAKLLLMLLLREE